MKQALWCGLMIVGLLIVAAVSAYSDEPPGKRRMPWDLPEYTKSVEIETAKRMFNKRLRDPFKQPRRKYVPDCGNPFKRISYPEFLTAKNQGKVNDNVKADD